MKSLRISSVATLRRYADEGYVGHAWYDEAFRDIAKVCSHARWDVERFVSILAITSPRCQVLRNVRMTLALHFGLPDSIVPMRSVRTGLQRYADGRGIAGPKTSAFARAILGDPDAVVLDVWLALALGVKQSLLSGARVRNECIRRIALASHSLGLSPRDGQAAIWSHVRRGAGWSPAPMSVWSEYQTAIDRGYIVGVGPL